MKIVTVVGARPQFVKASVVSRALAAIPGLTELLVHTGQHYDDEMSDVFFRELGLPRPHLNLGIGSGSHGAQTGKMLAACEQVLVDERPDWLLVYGDTNSTMAAALAAVKMHIPIAHVEAGLRTSSLSMPEEVNRIVTDQVATLNFTPTAQATANLAREGLAKSRVLEVGDVMYDVALNFGAKAEAESTVLRDHGLQPHQYLLATVHRAQNTDEPGRLRAIFEAFETAGRDVPVICPLHPRTRQALERTGFRAERVMLVKPVGYLDMLQLEKNARLVVTDSGGVQKEAFFYRVHCVTLMNETAWAELVTLGWNHLVEPDSTAAVVTAIVAALKAGPGRDERLYGDGHAAERVARALAERGR